MLACSFVLLEIGHPGLLYFLALAGGASAAFFASWLGYDVAVQYVVFFVACTVAMAFVYFFVQYIAVHNRKSHRSNTDLLLGKMVTIIDVQSPKVGQGKLGGETWLVKLQGDGELIRGMKVYVVGVQGCHLQVHISA